MTSREESAVLLTGRTRGTRTAFFARRTLFEGEPFKQATSDTSVSEARGKSGARQAKGVRWTQAEAESGINVREG